MSRSKRDYERHLDNTQDLPGYDEWLDEHKRQVNDEDLQQMYERHYEAPMRGKAA